MKYKENEVEPKNKSLKDEKDKKFRSEPEISLAVLNEKLHVQNKALRKILEGLTKINTK